jgi:hypothetical protein
MERRKFTREFKLEAVRLIKERGVSYVQASKRGSVLDQCNIASSQIHLQFFNHVSDTVPRQSIGMLRCSSTEGGREHACPLGVTFCCSWLHGSLES